MQETYEMWVRILGWEDPLEKGMATHSSILAWKILWTEEPGGLQSIGLQRVRYDWSDLAHMPLPEVFLPLFPSLKFQDNSQNPSLKSILNSSILFSRHCTQGNCNPE